MLRNNFFLTHFFRLIEYSNLYFNRNCFRHRNINFYLNLQMTNINGTRFVTMRDYCCLLKFWFVRYTITLDNWLYCVIAIRIHKSILSNNHTFFLRGIFFYPFVMYTW
jgi:hypothetical protein